MQNVPPPLQIAAGAAILATALWAGCQRPSSGRGPTASERENLEQRVAQYFRSVADLPADVTLEIRDLVPTDAPYLLQADLEIGDATSQQRVPIVMTRDGRFLIQGILVDLREDPHAQAQRRIRTDGHPVRGVADALVTIVVYVDFQCPFSARSYITLMDAILPAYADSVRVVLKHFPLATVHPWAVAASMAAACAHEQDSALFWSAADLLFREQERIDAESLRGIMLDMVRRSGADSGRFAHCFDDANAAGRIADDEAEGARLGVRSTPTFFINGRKLEGARPFEELSAAVDAARTRAGADIGATRQNATQGAPGRP